MVPENGANNKISTKIKRKLRGWDVQRIKRILNVLITRHGSILRIYNVFLAVFKMHNYSFHIKRENKLIPKSVREVFDDFQKMENDLQNDSGRDRYCSDGEPVIIFEDGWAWFGVAEGCSAQEAAAMRHCGNGEGGNGDFLLSLRQSVEKQGVTFWKPHLTFILNKGYLGEMKGFGNQKPSANYHSYIEVLLFMK